MSSAAASTPPAFAGLVHDLRDHIIEHCERLGEPLDTPDGLLTLDANSVLAAGRARPLLRLLAEQGAGSVAGRRVLDVGAGFGALALYCANLGADVVAVDPDEQRMQVALTIARRRGLALQIAAADAQSLPFPDASFDVAIAEDSLSRIIDDGAHRAALAEIRRVLRPGGWVAMRNPTRRVTEALGRHRSEAPLRSPRATVRQLRRAGFTHARRRPQPGRGLGARFAGRQHVLARRPEDPER